MVQASGMPASLGRALNIIYIMRNHVSVESGPLLAPHGICWASGSVIDVERPPPLQQTFAPIATKVRPPITGLPKETPPRLLREQEFAPCSAENCGIRAFCFTNSVASTRPATVCLKSDGLNCRVLDRFQGCLPVALMGLLLHALHSKDMTVVMIPQLLHAPKHDHDEEPGA